MSQGSAHTPEVKQETAVQQAVVQPSEKVYTAAEYERHQAPIRDALEPEDAIQFKWIGETGTIQTYAHTETGRNIHTSIIGASSTARTGRRPARCRARSRDAGGTAHSQNEYENSLGLGL